MGRSSVWVIVLGVLVFGSWYMFYQSGQEVAALERELVELYDSGAADDEVRDAKVELRAQEGPRIFSGILLTFLSAGLVGIVFATMVLPILAEKLTHAVYGSGEEVGADPLQEAKALKAQGEWERAIECFRKGLAKDPSSRRAWAEISSIQRVNQEDPEGAIETLRTAIGSEGLGVDDVAFLMFRLVEIYEEDFQDQAEAGRILAEVMERFPETRHSANARSRLQEWGMA